MYKYLAFPLVEPVQEEEELRNAPPGTVLSPEAQKRRVERAFALIVKAIPELSFGNMAYHHFAAGTLLIESDRDMRDRLKKLNFYYIDYSDPATEG